MYMLKGRMDSEGRVITQFMPLTGETIFVEGLEECVVEEIFHDTRDNFIRLRVKESICGNPGTVHRFTVEE